jgi:hypothetical protein
VQPPIFIIIRHAPLDECLHFSQSAGRLSLLKREQS